MTTPSAQGAAAQATAAEPVPAATAPVPTPAAATPVAWTPAGDPVATPHVATAAGRTPSTMPRDLRRLRAAAPVACALTGIAASGFLGTTGLQASPAATTRQLSHVTAAKQAFQRADVAAAEIVAARTLGGKPAARTTYDAAIRSVNTSLVAAADAAPGAEGLADAAGDLTAYTTAVERALAAPATSTAVASAYLKAADEARANVLTRMDTVATADLDRLRDGGGASSRPGGTLLVLLIGGGSTIGLGLASWWLARKTHRIVNPGLAAATLVTAGLTFLTLVPSARPGTDAGAAVNRATSVAALRDNLYAARVTELRPLLTGENTDAAWERYHQAASRNLTADVQDDWVDYRTYHQDLRTAQGQNAKVSELARTTEAFGSIVATVDANAADAQRGLDRAVTVPATITAGVALGAGLLAGGLAWAGIGRRLEEYR